MNIPYRHRRVLQRVGAAALVLLLITIVAWLCWVLWLQRYVVYVDDGAVLDFEHSSYDVVGEEAVPPKAAQNISIFYNEGADAIDTTNEMSQIIGYYIDSDMFKNDLDNVLLQLERLPAGTPIMIEMKGGYGSFYYSSQLADAVHSASTDIDSVDALIKKLQTKGFYTIAQVSALRDREFGNNHVSSGLYMLNRKGLWMDSGGMYWLDPTSSTTTNWITSVVLELKELGFDEVLLDNFCFPSGDQYIFNADKTEALQAAATTLMSTCGSSDFVLSFRVDSPTFTLPEGRCRMYLNNIDPNSISTTASQVTFDDSDVRLVFLCETGDTRYDAYSVLRSLNVAEEVEARKGN